MLYMRTENNVDLIQYCRNCNFTEVIGPEQLADPVISTNFDRDIKTYKQYLNPNIKNDVTLPRVSNIECPSKTCSKRPEEDNEVIYIKHDPVNMKFIYMCCKCDHFF
jgi:hypothetical protein